MTNNTTPDLAVGSYEFVFSPTGATFANWTASNSSARSLTVVRAGHALTIFINGATGNATVTKGDNVNITVSSNATGSNVTASMNSFTMNFTGTNGTFVVAQTDFGALYNTSSTGALTAGVYHVSAGANQSANFTSAANVTVFLTVSEPAAAAETTSSSSGGGSAAGSESRKATVSDGGASINFAKGSEHGLLGIEIATQSKPGNVFVSVRKLSSRPSGVTSDPSGSVYRYISISQSGVASGEIVSGKIDFEVDDDWLIDNGYAPTNVVLSRYDNGVWETLVTRYIGSFGGMSQFEADTPGFSYFSITADTAVAESESASSEETSEEAPVGTEEPATAAETPVETTSISTTSSSSENDTVMVVAAVVIVAAAAFFLFKTKGAAKASKKSSKK
jgi:PGF-pre-PGF domain-containing protein